MSPVFCTPNTKSNRQKATEAGHAPSPPADGEDTRKSYEAALLSMSKFPIFSLWAPQIDDQQSLENKIKLTQVINF